MTVKEAVAILTKKYPGRVVLGYWEDGDDYIFNTKPITATIKPICNPLTASK